MHVLTQEEKSSCGDCDVAHGMTVEGEGEVELYRGSPTVRHGQHGMVRGRARVQLYPHQPVVDRTRLVVLVLVLKHVVE